MGDWMNGNPQEQQAIRRFLRAYADRAGDARGMGGLLEALCAYYDADRVRILTADAQHTQLGTALVRCREGAAPREPFALALDGPLPGPEEGILISSVEVRFAPGSPTGRALAVQGVHSVMAEPLERDGAVYGFVAVENPRRHAGCCPWRRRRTSAAAPACRRRRIPRGSSGRWAGSIRRCTAST